MADRALERMRARLKEVDEELRGWDDRRAALEHERHRIQTAIDVHREFDPFPVDGDRFDHLNLGQKSLADACAAILWETREPATARDLTNVLISQGRWRNGKEQDNAIIGVLSVLKRHPVRFVRLGNRWALTELIPEVPAKNGHDTNGSLSKPAEAGKS